MTMIMESQLWLHEPASTDVISVASLARIAQICYILQMVVERIRTRITSKDDLIDAIKTFLDSAKKENKTQIRFAFCVFEFLFNGRGL